jgi:hypothetical protein
MINNKTKIFASYHPNNHSLIQPFLSQINTTTIDDCGIAVIFLSKHYIKDERLMLEEFAYASVVIRKPFLPVWFDDLSEIQAENVDRQLLCTLEMLVAKHPGTTIENLITALENFTPDTPFYTPSKPQICEKPCEAYEGDEPYLFISYAHDDAKRIYPIIKDLYESGWDLWYDEGIKTTERYLPVIADNLNRCSAVILMLTNRCLARPFIMNYELEYARKLNIPVIPVLLEDVMWTGEATISADELAENVKRLGFPNRGKRAAVPPAIRQNVVYDVVLPPEVEGFEIAVSGDEITLVRMSDIHFYDERDITIPGSVTSPCGELTFRVSIGDGGFKEYEELRSVIITEGAVSVGNEAFRDCFHLETVSILDGLTNIGYNAFYNCNCLKEIKIPDSVTSIGYDAFERTAWFDNQPDGVIYAGKVAYKWKGKMPDCTAVEIKPGTVSIEGLAFFNCFNLTSIVFPDSLLTIEESAFEGCKRLESIIIPESVTSIKEFAFNGCTRLKSVTIPDSVSYISNYAFNGCGVKIPGRGDENNEIQINEDYGIQINENKKEQQLLLPQCTEKPRALICCAEEDIEQIRTLLIELYWEGFNIFYEETPGQQTITDSACVLVFFSENTEKSESAMSTLKQAVEADVSRIIQVFLGEFSSWIPEVRDKLHDRQAIFQKSTSEREFSGKIRESLRIFNCSLGHPRGFDVKNMGDSVEIVKFHPTGFSEVIIPKTFFNPPLPVTHIGEKVFRFCKLLTDIIIPKGVINVGEFAFWECESLINFRFPDSVINIGAHAFSDCVSLVNINIPNSVVTIGAMAFKKCTSLVNIIIPDSVVSIGSYIFEDCTSLSNINLSNNITSIEFMAFNNCTSLTNIIIPDNITSIGSFAFRNCTSLTNIVIPDNITSIGDSAFWGCSSLTNINIPNSITNIGNSAFGGCKNLVDININKDNKYFINIDNVLFNKNKCKLN